MNLLADWLAMSIIGKLCSTICRISAHWIIVVHFSVVVFQVCIQNRYKLNKKYRKWMNSLQTDNAEQITRGLLKQAKVFVTPGSLKEQVKYKTGTP